MILKNIDRLINGNGEITLGRVRPIGCTAIASDENNCLAMLVRDPDESLASLLERLDAAIEDAIERDIYTDELNA